MNILFLIGNGFDLNLGMKTRYSDFYKYYKSIKTTSNLVKRLKTEIDGNIENWSDLELALGEYTRNLNSTEEFNEVFENIEDNLAEYLDSEEKNFDFNQFDIKKLFQCLANPENYLLPTDKDKIKVFIRKWNNEQHNINIITFNYTKSIEKLVDYKDTPIQINKYTNKISPSIIIQKIEHVHGYTNERMVMGVNDTSQISNNKFHTNQEIIETLIKSECNQAQKHNIDVWCKKQILESNLICIFGSSIGDTDNMWWKLIGEQLLYDCNLIIFEKLEPIPPRRPQKGQIVERNKKKYFLDKTNLSDEERRTVNDKIFFSINSKIFNIRLN